MLFFSLHPDGRGDLSGEAEGAAGISDALGLVLGSLPRKDSRLVSITLILLIIYLLLLFHIRVIIAVAECSHFIEIIHRRKNK